MNILLHGQDDRGDGAHAAGPGKRFLAVALVAIGLLVVTACGRAVAGNLPSGSATETPSPSAETSPNPTPSATPTGSSQPTVFTDSDLGLSLRIPMGLTVVKEGASFGALGRYRAFDPAALANGYPTWEVEFQVYPRGDSTTTLQDWVRLHSGHPTPAANPPIFWESVDNLKPSQVAGRPGATFDSTTTAFPTPLHFSILFWTSDKVFALDWWQLAEQSPASDAATQMLASFGG
jgi:hypothetical protein